MKRVIVLLCVVGLASEALSAQRATPGRESLRADLADPQSLCQTAGIHASQGQYTEAIAVYEQLMRQTAPSLPPCPAHHELGILYSKAGQHDKAITTLREAVTLMPYNFVLLAILGSVYRDQQRLPEALQTYQQALRLAEDSHGQRELIDRLRHTVATLEPMVAPPASALPTYRLTVNVSPPGSTVRFANSQLQYHPGIALPPGAYLLQVEHPGYTPKQQRVTIPNADVTLTMALEASHYALTVRATPPDSKITLRNHSAPYTPGLPLSPGRYDVVVTRDGYRDAQRTVTIQDKDVTLDVPLERLETLPPTILVTSHDVSRPHQVSPETTRVTLKGQVTDDSGVTAVTINGTTVALRAQGAFTHEAALEYGENTLVITASDVHQNSSRAQLTINRQRDRIPPRITLLSELTVSEPRTRFRGRVSAANSVTEVLVNGRRVPLTADGTFTLDLDLQQGNNPVRVVAVDAQRTSAQEDFVIRYALAQTRIALVIGNSTYSTGALRNPRNDATDVAAALKRLGFAVTLRVDATHRDMEEAIETFSRQLFKESIGLFYYAGHGMQAGGANYLIPIDARLEAVTDVKYKTIHVNWLLERIDGAANGLNVVILDACRDNPFARNWRSTTVQRGLAAPRRTAHGTFIAYATAPGGVAEDGEERNGTYTKYLLRYMNQPLMVEQMFKQVRVGVMQETNGKQVPWESSSLMGDLSLVQQ